MSWDLDDILDTAGAVRGKPQLIEVGRAIGRGHDATTGYFWSTGRIGATVGPDWVRIRRRLGVSTDGIKLDAETVRSLAIACRAWSRCRDQWAAFYYSGGGFPPGYGGGISYYEAPGKHGEKIKIGGIGCLGHNKWGADLVGTEEVVPIEPRRLKPANAVAEIWRRGERQGPPTGSQVGLRYDLGKNVFLDARRNDARIWRRHGGDVYLEPAEESFAAALLHVMGRSTTRTPRSGRAT